MGLLPVSAQVILMHRRCNHVSPSLLYLAINKKLTSGLCAKKPSASICSLSVIDCLACTLAKSKVAENCTRSRELLSVGRERQRVPGHITPRGMHCGIVPYDFLALDLKTRLTQEQGRMHDLYDNCLLVLNEKKYSCISSQVG